MSWMVLALDTMKNSSKFVTGDDISKAVGWYHPIDNVGLTQEIADGMRILSGAADMACFGRLYSSIPDLPERFANPLPPTPGLPNTGPMEYTDFSNQ